MKYKVIGETSYQTRLFVEEIVRIMARRKITRMELAHRLGNVRPSYVTKILSGRENMTVKTMEGMAEAVGYELVFGLRRLPGKVRSKGEAEAEVLRNVKAISKRRS